MPDDMTPVIRTLIIAIIFLILGLIWVAEDKATNPVYCLITQQPFGFSEIHDLPYQEIAPLQWNSIVGFPELTQPPRLAYSIVPGSCAHIIQVYMQDNDFYMMQFAQARGDDGNPHPEHAAWVSP